MRYQLGLSSPTPNVTLFLIIIIASYLAFALLGGTQLGAATYNFLVLDPQRAIFKGQIWRLVTYGFLHNPTSPFHVIFNSLVLYMVGTPLEERWGEKRFFIFIMCSVVLGGVMVCLSYLIGLSHATVVGFSAATLALVVAWGLTFSTQNIYIFGILPLTGRQLVFVTIGFEILYAASSNSISSAAHFGGILTAFILTFGIYKPSRIRQLYYQFKLKNRSRK